MPNTAVKLLSADGSWNFVPVRVGRCHAFFIYVYSAIAQLAERMTVNHDVAGSSPACGVSLESCPSWLKEHGWKPCRRFFRLKGSNPLLSVKMNSLYDIYGALG